MKKTSRVFTMLGMGVCAATLLVDRFVIAIPDWLAIILAMGSIILFFIGFYQGFKKN